MRTLAGLVLFMAACSTSPAALGSDPVTEREPETSSTTSQTGQPEAAAFLSTLLDTLGGTGLHQAIVDDPEPFVTAGLVMCESLHQGTSPSGVIDQFLAAFGDEPDDLDSALAGALLGSAVNVFCPEHRPTVVDELG